MVAITGAAATTVVVVVVVVVVVTESTRAAGCVVSTAADTWMAGIHCIHVKVSSQRS